MGCLHPVRPSLTAKGNRVETAGFPCRKLARIYRLSGICRNSSYLFLDSLHDRSRISDVPPSASALRYYLAGCRILLAQKAFSMYSVYPLIRQYLSGTAASGLYEARLGKTEFGGETHVFSAAYRPDEFDEILNYADTSFLIRRGRC